MEKLEIKHNDFIAALATLHVGLRRFSDCMKNADMNKEQDHETADLIRDAVIQRFEYCFELAWKYIAVYLQEKSGIVLEQYSPNYIFRKACHAGLISESETIQSLQMVVDRNKTSHIYKEEVADSIATISAPKYYEFMQILADRFKP